MRKVIFELEVFGGAHEAEHQALAHVQRALQLAANSARSAGGAVTSGDILTDGATLIGRWKFTWSETQK